jgi:hypothetical protein
MPKKIPNANVQTPKKLQDSNLNVTGINFEISTLGFLWRLEFCDLEFFIARSCGLTQSLDGHFPHE